MNHCVLVCLRCGDRYTIGLPCLLDVYIATMKGYIRAHRHCKGEGTK